jgi:hypothetical protein
MPCAMRRCGTNGDGVDDRQEGYDQGGLGCDRDHEGRQRPREEGDDMTAASEVQPHHVR